MRFFPNKKKNLYILIAFILIQSIVAVAIIFYAVTNSGNTNVATSNSNVEGIPLPVIMYHGLIKDSNLQNKFYINPATFEQDLNYLEGNGYTTILMEDLINYVTEPHASLPEKPILLTFDDGYYNNYLYAFPLLKEKNMKATISIIGSMTEKFSNIDENNAAYSHVTWPQINEMIESGLVEIQNHTMDMHTYNNGRKGSMQKDDESLEQYNEALSMDVDLLQERILEMTGHSPSTFTYPFGYIGENSESVLKEHGFKATLSCEEGINIITKNPDCLFKLKRNLRPLNGSISNIL